MIEAGVGLLALEPVEAPEHEPRVLGEPVLQPAVGALLAPLKQAAEGHGGGDLDRALRVEGVRRTRREQVREEPRADARERLAWSSILAYFPTGTVMLLIRWRLPS